LALRYNLGCGFKKMEGYVNVDRAKICKPDILADVTEIPWTWAKSNQAGEIYMGDLAEHITREQNVWIKVLQECHRVLEKGGLLRLRVPEFREGNLLAAVTDLTHVNWFTVDTLDYLDCRHSRWKNFSRAYGVPAFDRVGQARKGRHLIIQVRAHK